MSKNIAVITAAVITAAGTILAPIIANTGSIKHTNKTNDTEKNIVIKNTINNNGSAKNENKETNKVVLDNKEKNKKFAQPYKRPEDAVLTQQRKECVTSNGSENIEFPVGLFFKFYSFSGANGKYTLDIGNNESGRLYLNLGDPPVTVYFKNHEYNLWATKSSNGLFHVCIKMQ